MKPRIKKIDSAKFYHTDPRNILDNINSIPELYYLANITMSTTYRSKVNPEVPLLIGYEPYSKLINYYGGTSLSIPTREELQSNLLGIMSYYYYNIKGLSWSDTMKELGMTQTKGSRRLLRNRWKAFKEIVESQESKMPELSETNNNESLVPESEAPVFCEDTYVKKETFNKVLKTVLTDLSENQMIDDNLLNSILSRYDI